MEERIFHVLMKELCAEGGVKVNTLSYGWILQLSKDGKVRHITGNRFDINPEATGNIACDKYATYEVLKSQNIPIIEHKMIFNPAIRSLYISEEGNWNEIIQYFVKNNSKVVVKPNNGCEGQGVYLCKNLGQVEIAITKLFKSNGSISICPYYNIKTEYRTFYLDGQCLLIYGKIKPFVIGDGIHNVGELIENLNLPKNGVTSENINNIDLSYVPKSKEKFEISWKHNLSGGAKPEILKDKALKNNIENLVKRAGEAMNIKFATIDVILTEDNKLFILEVNSGVCMTKFIDEIQDGYEIAKEVYRKALRKLFE